MDTRTSAARLDGRYVLTSRLATGATAVVWRAVDELLDRPVAVKILHSHLTDDHGLTERFADEARLAATVSHPSLVAIYDTVPGPPPAIVMELVDGPDMRQRLDAGPCSISDVLGLGCAVADALDVAHRAGLIHRDVKPANIICTQAGHPKLGDFGIATVSAGDRTATGLVLGTAKYLAPEQVRGERIDARTDVYALSVVLYEALCGQVPFERPGDLPTAMARLEEPPPIPRSLRPDVPTGVESVVLRGLAREPGSRWPSAAALRDALRTEAEALGVQPGPIDLSCLAGPIPGSDLDRTTTAGAPAPTEPTRPLGPVRSPRPAASSVTTSGRRPRRMSPAGSRWMRRTLVGAGFGAVLALGAALVAGGDPVTELFGDPASSEVTPTMVRASAFDPDGTGPAGEHDDLAENVLDGDLGTHWNTERYEDRSMGAKRGVGIVVELAEPARINQIFIGSDGEDWGLAVYVADSAATLLEDWGPPVVVADGLGPDVTFDTDVTAAAVLVWVTDLGDHGPPYRLQVDEVAIS